jgi:putative phosphonoacetaldehyde dehydrogenase
MPTRTKLVERSKDRTDIVNPYTGRSVGSVRLDRSADVTKAIATLKTYDHRLSPEARKTLLTQAADALERRRDEFAALITAESGNCIKDSRKEVDRSLANLRLAAAEAVQLHGEALSVAVGGSRKIAMTVHEPVGVVCAITPFNRPLNQVVVKVAPALAANNAIIVKPSEKTPLTAIAFAELLLENGCPENMIAVVVGFPEEIGPVLTGSPLVDMITFTGSVETGERLARQVGIKKIVLELGGNDPLIVLGDADLDAAAKIAAEGALATAGQSCRGIKRLIVEEQVADAFVARLLDQVRSRRCGDPFDALTDIGTLIDEAAARRVEARCARALEDGATLVHGGERRGALFQPTLLDRVPPTTELVVAETFGPIAPVIRVRDDHEAIAVANGTRYGLQAGVATRSFERFMAIATRLRVGGVALMDGPNFDSPQIPFGGVKASGIGREGIRYTMREMSNVKTVLLPWAGPDGSVRV